MLTRRAPSAALLPLAEAAARLTAGLSAVAPVRLPLRPAIGAVAAEDVTAAADLPDRPVACRDGWAVPFAAVAGASAHAPVALPAMPPWVESGAVLPAGTDTVLPPEAIEDPPEPAVTADAPPGDGTVLPGTGLRAGERLLTAGERVTTLSALGLALAGIESASVRSPRVRLVLTGDPSAEPDGLGPVLAALVEAAGGEVPAACRAPDDLEPLAAAIAAGDDADAVFVVGGTGWGRADHSAAALARAGHLAAHGIALRPGETAGFGRVRNRPVLLLPGRPDAALAAFLGLGEPLLRALAAAAERPRLPGTLTRKVSSVIGASEVVFVRRGPGGGIEPLGGAEIPLRHLLRAEGAILVPPEREGYPPGTAVEMMPL